MIAPHHNGSFEFALLDQVIHGQSKLRTLAVSEPTDARRQALKLNALAREINPAAENAVIGK